ncbi:hypothetical protein BT69DRAFT_1293431 [Atractiella rhizophila]|nr:hypothetical protein BT69DRAFT_1293431 [Atractiella rhizophila]
MSNTNANVSPLNTLSDLGVALLYDNSASSLGTDRHLFDELVFRRTPTLFLGESEGRLLPLAIAHMRACFESQGSLKLLDGMFVSREPNARQKETWKSLRDRMVGLREKRCVIPGQNSSQITVEMWEAASEAVIDRLEEEEEGGATTTDGTDNFSELDHFNQHFFYEVDATKLEQSPQAIKSILNGLDLFFNFPWSSHRHPEDLIRETLRSANTVQSPGSHFYLGILNPCGQYMRTKIGKRYTEAGIKMAIEHHGYELIEVATSFVRIAMSFGYQHHSDIKDLWPSTVKDEGQIWILRRKDDDNRTGDPLHKMNQTHLCADFRKKVYQQAFNV